jgi:hypothetical protein
VVEVASLTLAGESFDFCLASFLDEFNEAPKETALRDEPALLAPRFGWLGQVRDAYLAAAAEELGRRHGLPIPAWTEGEARRLHRPWVASPLAALRAVLLVESPAGFRARNLFVSENALSRV